jgi:uncharacterized membrane protein YcgQ (UPF0703/DUF1980 family)
MEKGTTDCAIDYTCMMSQIRVNPQTIEKAGTMGPLINTDYAYLSFISHLSLSISIFIYLYLSLSIYLSIYLSHHSFYLIYLLFILSPIRHRPRQAEHPLMAALRARRGSTAAIRGCSACLPLILGKNRGQVSHRK